MLHEWHVVLLFGLGLGFVVGGFVGWFSRILFVKYREW